MKKSLRSYLILVACCGMIAATYGFINSAGLYFDSMSLDLNVGKGDLSFYVTIYHLTTAIFAPTIAFNIRRKYNVKLILIICGALTMSGFLLVPHFNHLWQFYIFGFVFGACTAIFGNNMVVETLNLWFDRAGTAIGIALAFSGVFGSLYAPIAVSLIDKHGWRNAYYSYAIIFSFIIIYSILVFKKKDDVQIETNNKKEKMKFDKPLILISLFYIMGSVLSSIPNYILGFSKTIGLSSSQGAFLSSSINFGNLVSKVLIGILLDKIGAYKSVLFNLISITIGLVGIMVFKQESYILLIISCFLFGNCFCTSTVLSQGVCGALYGKENVGRVYSTITIFTIISSFSSPVIGYMYDYFNSYYPAMILLLGIYIISVILVIIAFKIKKVK